MDVGKDYFLDPESFEKGYQRGEKDVLERKEFVKYVTQEIFDAFKKSEGNTRESNVFAICADWGDGKTFIKKKVIALFDQMNKKGEASFQVQMLDFNPWQNASGGEVDRYFLGELEKLTSYLKKNKESNQQDSVIKLSATDKAAFDFKSLIQLPLMIGIVSVGFSFLELNKAIFDFIAGVELFVFVFTFFIVTSVCIKFCDLLSSFGDLKEKMKFQDRELREVKDDITFLLGKHKDTRLLVFIDDIDRLNAMQIVDVFRNVQQNENIPNVIFLLFYKKEYVLSAYKELRYHGDRKYIEKVVQVEFVVPDVPINILISIFDDRLTRAFKDVKASIYYDELNRHKFIFVSALRNIRGINNYFNSVNNQKINITSYDNSKFEYWIPDFLLIECLKFIDSDFYEFIKKNLHIVLGDHSFREAEFSLKNRIPTSVSTFQRLLNSKINNSSNQDEISYILKQCFSNLSAFVGSEEIAEFKIANSENANQKRRVDSVRYGYNYFSSSYRRKVIDQEKALAIIDSNINRSGRLEDFIKDVFQNGLSLKEYFEELRLIYGAGLTSKNADPKNWLISFITKSLNCDIDHEAIGLVEFKELNYLFISTTLVIINENSERLKCMEEIQSLISLSEHINSFILYPLIMRVFSQYREFLGERIQEMYVEKFEKVCNLNEQYFLHVLNSQRAEYKTFLNALLSITPFVDVEKRKRIIGKFLEKLIKYNIFYKIFYDGLLEDTRVGDLYWNEVVIGQLQYLFEGHESVLVNEVKKILADAQGGGTELEAILKYFEKKTE